MRKELIKINRIKIRTAVSFIHEVGDISRFKSANQVQKYAGLTLKENSSSKYKGLNKISKRDRKKLSIINIEFILDKLLTNREILYLFLN